MRKSIFLLIVLIFVGCSVAPQKTKKIKNLSKCYINKTEAPFWVCYQSTFSSVGKVYTSKFSRLKQEEAYSISVNNLIQKLQNKTFKLLEKLNIKDKSILKDVKSFVIINATEDNHWFDKNRHILYVKASINEKRFKEFLKDKIKNKDFEKYYNETF